MPFNIVNTELTDLPAITKWFDESIAYQRKKGYPTWGNYDQGAIIKDINNRNYYKAVNNEGTGIVFGLVYNDKIIWRHHDDNQSVYLHRIVVNPAFKGQKMFGVILDWVIGHVKQRGLKNIRMDTWADNPNIIRYYESYGFVPVENYRTPDTEELPVHNRNLDLTLLEYRGSF